MMILHSRWQLYLRTKTAHPIHYFIYQKRSSLSSDSFPNKSHQIIDLTLPWRALEQKQRNQNSFIFIIDFEAHLYKIPAKGRETKER